MSAVREIARPCGLRHAFTIVKAQSPFTEICGLTYGCQGTLHCELVPFVHGLSGLPDVLQGSHG